MIAFADETKENGYSFAVFLVEDQSVAKIRKSLKAQRRPSQTAIHFSKENNETRKSFLKLMQVLECDVLIYTTKKKSTRGRRACLKAIIGDLELLGVSRLVLDLDQSVRLWDRENLVLIKRELAMNYEFEFKHDTISQEPALWVADAVAWCFNRKGDWFAEASAVVTEIIHLD